MNAPPPNDTTGLLAGFSDDDGEAIERLIQHTQARLLKLASKMLKTFPGVGRYEQTDDVYQNAILRLAEAVRSQRPQNSRHFYNLAAKIFRRVLIDLARHYDGPEGIGANQVSKGDNLIDPPSPTELNYEPETIQQWTLFHEFVEALPDEEREITNLMWFQGLTQTEAAKVLGVSSRTVKRRWLLAKHRLYVAMEGENPDSKRGGR